MKRLVIGILILFILTGCNQQSGSNQVIEENPPVQDLVNGLRDKLFTETNAELKVLKFNSKVELVNSLTDITKESIAKEYVDKYYLEKSDGLYLNPKEQFTFINVAQPYDLEKIDNNHYLLTQESESSVGDQLIKIVLEKKERWIITDIQNVFIDPPEPPVKKENEIVTESKDINSDLLLINKEHELPADYVPYNLVEVNIPFSFTGKSEKKQLRKEAALHLEELINKALEENISIYGVSGYRSYKTQEAIFAYNVKTYGSEEEANQVSAHPGQSEHQTGLTMDVSASSVNYGLVERFAETKEGKWLKENAAKFGFIIRYPKGKEEITGYTYEPWHIRYVGQEHAEKIMAAGITLEEYIEKAKNE